MKRCPECRRDYTDETLNFCLDDGSVLLDGPAKSEPPASAGGFLPADEPATAFLSEPPASGGGQFSESATHAQLHTTDQTAVFPSNEDAIRAQTKSRRFSRPLIIGLAIVLIAGAVFAYYKFAGQGMVVSFEGATLNRVTDSGEINFAAISPDGKLLAYNFYISGRQEGLWLQQVGVAGSSSQIVAPAEIGILGITFSPDNKYIYYTAREKADDFVTGSLYQLPVIGGTAKKLLTKITSKVAFSPDGKRIAYFHNALGEDQTKGVEFHLMIANADGSEQRTLVSRGGNEYIEDGPAWSPDGKNIVCVSGAIEPRVTNLVAVSPETGEIMTISTGRFRGIDDPAWVADGKSLIVLAKEKTFERSKIWQISYPSGEVRKVSAESNDPGKYLIGLSLSADSSTLATTQYTDTSTMWTSATNDPSAATQLKLGSDLAGDPAWTSDGKIVFSKFTGDSKELFIPDSQGGALKQLTSNGSDNADPDVSPDGRHIVFTSNQSGNNNLWRIDINGDNPKQLTTTGRNYVSSISPDGREVYYTCNANMRDTICKIGIDGGEPVQLTNKPSASPQISADGKWLLCFYLEGSNVRAKIAIVPTAGGEPVKTFPIPDAFDLTPRWMPDDRSFYYTTTKAYVGNLWVQPIDGGSPKQYTNFNSLYLPWADFSRDGKIVYRRGSSVADVILISGFKK